MPAFNDPYEGLITPPIHEALPIALNPKAPEASGNPVLHGVLVAGGFIDYGLGLRLTATIDSVADVASIRSWGVAMIGLGLFAIKKGVSALLPEA